MLEVAEIIRLHGATYLARFADRIRIVPLERAMEFSELGGN